MLADSQNNSSERILNLKTNNNAGVGVPTKRMKLDDTRFQCVVCQSNKVSLSELHWHQTYQHSTEELSLSVIGWKGLVKVVSAPKKLSSQMEKENNTEQRSIWNSFSKKPSQFYYLSSSILRVNGEQGDNAETPIDCTVPLGKEKRDNEEINGVQSEDMEVQVIEEEVQEVEDVEEVVEVKEQEEEEEDEDEREEEEVKEEEEEEEVHLVWEADEEEEEQEAEEEQEEDQEEEIKEEVEEKVVAVIPKSCSIPLVRVERYFDIPIVPKEEVTADSTMKEEVFSEEEEECRGFEKSSIDISVYDRYIDMRLLKKELCWTREISMEDFIRSANGLCHELEDYKRLSALKKSLRRKNIL